MTNKKFLELNSKDSLNSFLNNIQKNKTVNKYKNNKTDIAFIY